MEFFKILLPALVSFVMTIVLMPFVIKFFKRKQLGQYTRDEGPKWHEHKTGTPTMGGVAFILATLVAGIIVPIINGTMTPILLLLLFTLLLYGLIGFFDDYIKVVMKRNLGLTSSQKFIAQVIGGIIFYICIIILGLPSLLPFPLLGEVNLGPLYALFVVFWIVGFSNATNLTDGIDGLLASTSMIALAAYGVIAYVQNQWDVLTFIMLLIGGILGFFIFNKKPAKIFMGDVGSLAIGAILAGISILLKQEWSLLIIGIIFVIETASVILQVAYFKQTGKRIFKMTPIHHHFEMSGYGEWKIVGLFSLVTFIFSLVLLAILL